MQPWTPPPFRLALLVASAAVVAAQLVGCASPGERPPALDDPETRSALETALLDVHNAARSAPTPTPTPALEAVTWSSSLAEEAQAWAERCVFEHSTSPHGENLSLLSNLEVTPASADRAATLWANEAPFYNYENNSCAAGEQCGHYTQMVWRDTTQVGCGVAVCDDVAGFGPGTFWVCNYNPPGNFVGQRPY